MRIALVAPFDEAVPPMTYGGTERVVHYLAEQLVKSGHDVLLIAAGGSQTGGTLLQPITRPLRSASPSADVLQRKRDLAAAVSTILRAARVDVVHSHFRHLLDLAGNLPAPLVTTIHYPLDHAPQNTTFLAHPTANYIAISQSQKAMVPQLNVVAQIYHGVPLEQFPFERRQGEYLAFVGRVAPEKGLDSAINVARRTRRPLMIAAKVEPKHEKYFRQEIAPQLGRHGIQFLGELRQADKLRLLRNARALLFPVRWQEPFGLVLIEALACGTPVIGFPLGAIPEIINDGIVGMIVSDESEMVRAVGIVPQISRQRCRAHVRRHFSAAAMAARHVRTYQFLASM
jgi:glycosyltransferase involved in cell wall biosynthesis